MEDARTRIICTIGPASASPRVLARMMDAGMDVARLNFSHGTHTEHAALFENIHKAARKIKKTVAILQDLQGPKMRIGDLPQKGVELHEGETVTLTTKKVAYQKPLWHIPVTHKTLHREVKAGHRIFIDDGNIALSVLSVRGECIHCSVDVGGMVFAHKGINVPDTTLISSTLTKKDREDLEFGVQLGVDWVCISFVTSAKIIKIVRALAVEHARGTHRRTPRIMAKVERAAALERIDEIIDAADGIMLGRGDLGVEIPPEEVPLVQKDVAQKCRNVGKPCIVATHMLESMKTNPRATRAEISDVANAVFDHVDGVMLSAETATGKYPEASVQTMAQAIAAAERSRYDDLGISSFPSTGMGEAFAHVLARLSESKEIAAVVVVGGSAIAPLLFMYRPQVPLLVLVPDNEAARQVVMLWGAIPLVADTASATLLLRIRAIVKRTIPIKKSARIAVVNDVLKTGVQLSILEM